MRCRKEKSFVCQFLEKNAGTGGFGSGDTDIDKWLWCRRDHGATRYYERRHGEKSGGRAVAYAI